MMSCYQVLIAALMSANACSVFRDRPLPAVEYRPPAAGTRYHYRGFSHRVLSAQGWRVLFEDDSARKATLFAHFIMDDAARPSEIDSSAFAKLWPLAKGMEATVIVRNGDRAWKWMFKVVDQKRVRVPAGEFDSYVVQAVQRPEPFNDPKAQTMVGYTWMFAPEANAVVSFRTEYLSGPNLGRIVNSELQSISPANAIK